MQQVLDPATSASAAIPENATDAAATPPPSAEPSSDTSAHVPYEKDIRLDHGRDAVAARQRFVAAQSGVTLDHVARFSFEPEVTIGNIEGFTGVAQEPIGFAGPLHVRGEHANGEFLIPLATTEGTLVASYNRGIGVLNRAGGVVTTVSADRMQRAPVFIFESAREARDFAGWVQSRLDDLRRVAEATSHVARLQRIESYLAHRFAFLRFDFSTGDAAGQNMVGRATLAACEWIQRTYPNVRQFFLDSQFGSDKKVSDINTLRTRGKRVTAEATIPRAVLADRLRVTPEQLRYWAGVGSIGTHLAGATSNGLHAANAIAAMFIATGQDVANVVEGSAAATYVEITPGGDLYAAVTIPSLIVATHGGGTHLPTQRECLEVLGCYGRGQVEKLAEIVAGVVLAGELSLGAAICTLDWVSSHERFGRNR
jgi:hydroxymethylglutaryl-CoA reductase (NADPH)